MLKLIEQTTVDKLTIIWLYDINGEILAHTLYYNGMPDQPNEYYQP